MKQDDLCQMAELQRRIDTLEEFREMSVKRPELFDQQVLPAARDWLDGEIMQLEAAMLVLLEESKQPPGGATVSVGKLITPSVPHWFNSAQL